MNNLIYQQQQNTVYPLKGLILTPWGGGGKEYFAAVGTFKVLSVTYPTSNAKSLACDTVNEHSLERHAAAIRQLPNGDESMILYTYIKQR